MVHIFPLESVHVSVAATLFNRHLQATAINFIIISYLCCACNDDNVRLTIRRNNDLLAAPFFPSQISDYSSFHQEYDKSISNIMLLIESRKDFPTIFHSIYLHCIRKKKQHRSRSSIRIEESSFSFFI